ncbi:MAG: hypothetical protein AAF413_01675 [Patescibacteria group bacterium]
MTKHEILFSDRTGSTKALTALVIALEDIAQPRISPENSPRRWSALSTGTPLAHEISYRQLAAPPKWLLRHYTDEQGVCSIANDTLGILVTFGSEENSQQLYFSGLDTSAGSPLMTDVRSMRRPNSIDGLEVHSSAEELDPDINLGELSATVVDICKHKEPKPVSKQELPQEEGPTAPEEVIELAEGFLLYPESLRLQIPKGLTDEQVSRAIKHAKANLDQHEFKLTSHNLRLTTSRDNKQGLRKYNLQFRQGRLQISSLGRDGWFQNDGENCPGIRIKTNERDERLTGYSRAMLEHVAERILLALNPHGDLTDEAF